MANRAAVRAGSGRRECLVEPDWLLISGQWTVGSRKPGIVLVLVRVLDISGFRPENDETLTL